MQSLDFVQKAIYNRMPTYFDFESFANPPLLSNSKSPGLCRENCVFTRIDSSQNSFAIRIALVIQNTNEFQGASIKIQKKASKRDKSRRR